MIWTTFKILKFSDTVGFQTIQKIFNRLFGAFFKIRVRCQLKPDNWALSTPSCWTVGHTLRPETWPATLVCTDAQCVSCPGSLLPEQRRNTRY